MSDDDRVALNVMDFASPASTGAHALCFDLQQQLQQQWDNKDNSQQQTPSDDGSSSSSAHLSSSMYGSFGSTSYASLSSSSMASMDSPAGGQVCLPLPPFAMRAGPRDHVYFDPKTITAAIITTGEGGSRGFCMYLKPGKQQNSYLLLPWTHLFGVWPPSKQEQREIVFCSVHTHTLQECFSTHNGQPPVLCHPAGNICPGMNDVIVSMVKRMHDYGVPEDNILGIK